MGLVSPADVPPFFYVQSPMNLSQPKDKESAPQVGVTFNGTRRDVLIEDVIAIHGPRVPSAAESSQRPPPGFHLHRRRRPRGRSGQVAKLDRIRRAVGRFLRTGDRRPDAGRYPALAVGTHETAIRCRGRGLRHSCSRGPSGSTACPPAQPRTSPTAIDLKKLEAIEPLVRQEIEQRRLPGAVVLSASAIASSTRKRSAIAAQVPSREPMTLDTIFDLASLTKVVATTTSVMMLIEQGKLRLVDRVSTFIPGFERYGKADITIRHLLTHVSGLQAGRRSWRQLGRHRHRDSAGDRGSADRAAGRPVRLQRHQFFPARGDRPPRSAASGSTSSRRSGCSSGWG